MKTRNITEYLREKKLKTSEILALLSAASVLRQEAEMRKILYYLKEKRIDQVKIYETLLQTYLFAGFPSALISLKIAGEFFPVNSLKLNETKKDDFKKSGENTCRIIYGSKYEKLIENINKFSLDLAEWLVTEGYGKVLSRKGLSLKERELSIISILAAMQFEDQLYSHINGAFRLKINLKNIEQVIVNLDLLGRKPLKSFGLKVFEKFLKQKKTVQKIKQP